VLAVAVAVVVLVVLVVVLLVVVVVVVVVVLARGGERPCHSSRRPHSCPARRHRQ
jgi:flagellar basal body-associated protein FliL